MSSPGAFRVEAVLKISCVKHLIYLDASLLPLSNRLPHHNIKRNILLRTLQMNRATLLESKLPVDGRIDRIARLQVASPALSVGYLCDMLDELAGVTFATSSRTSAKVDEVPGVELAVEKGGVHGVMEEGKELVEEATLAFG